MHMMKPTSPAACCIHVEMLISFQASSTPRVLTCLAHLHACRLLAGESGVQAIDRFDASDFPTRFAAQIKNFDDEG
jgi:3-oxoacyl-(acyl-carrier-protein) synthase